MPTARVVHADCLDALRDLPDESVHAVVCDPPYGLANTDSAHVVETLTRWFAGERDYLPSGAGFMGKAWDAFVPPPAVWDECMRVLKPGGHLLAFAGTRTVDLMGLSIRLAGFDLRDAITWIYGSGFPKSLDVGKAIDKLDATPTRAHTEAQQWHGWGTALKPASEPIVVARKPLQGTVAGNVLAHGTGALNIDACRVDLGGERPPTGSGDRTGGAIYAQDEWTRTQMANGGNVTPTAGRWPANVVLDEHAAAALDTDSGTLTSGVPGKRGKAHDTDAMSGRLGMLDRTETGYADAGGASRFFPVFKYQAKAPAKERPSYEKDGESANPRVTGHGLRTRTCDTCGVRFSHGNAAQTCGHDGWSYVDTIAEAAGPTSKVAHPTVKPLALMQWLVRLVTPPGGTVLEPFAGSGTTVEAALLEGFDVIAIEREADYLPLIQQRIDRATAATTPTPEAEMDGLW